MDRRHDLRAFRDTGATDVFPNSTRTSVNPTAMPTSCETMKADTSAGRMPANVSVYDLAVVRAGLANDVDEVNQYAAAM